MTNRLASSRSAQTGTASDVAAGPSVASGRVFRGALTYGAAMVLQRGAPLILLPLFARVLTPEEYGQVGIVITLGAGIGTLVSFGLETAVFRGYLLSVKRPVDAARFVNTVGGFGLVAPLALALALAWLSAVFLAPVFAVPGAALGLGILAAAVTASATAVPMALLRAQERLRSYINLTWLQVGVSTALTFSFVALLGWGVVGWMVASLASAGVLLLRGLAILGHRWTRDFDRKALGSALRFGVPLIPHAAAHWGLAVSDRAVLGAFVPAAVVGAYYSAYLIVLPVNLVAIAISQATQPLFAEARGAGEHREDLGRVVTVQVLLVMLVTAVIALDAPPSIALVLPDQYSRAAEFAPWLATGAGLFGLYLIPMNAISVMAGRTQRVWVITVLAAALNIGLNLGLVPQIGAMAAAIDTTVGYAVLLAGVTLYALRVCGPALRLEPTRIGAGALLIAAGVAVGLLFDPQNALVSLLGRTALLVGVVAMMVLVGPMRAEARWVMTAVRSTMDRGRA